MRDYNWCSKDNGSKLDSFGIIITLFLVKDKKKKLRFFEEIFLLTDISMNIAPGIPFLTLTNVEIDFVDCHIH